MNIILFGVPGAGKGTQSQYLQNEFGMSAFSMGEALRAQITKKTELGHKIQSLIENGQFADDAVVKKLLNDRLDISTSNIIFDGFPRKISQVSILNEAITERNLKIDAVIVINVDEDILVKRITGRYTCQNCGHIYNDFYHPTSLKNICDICQSCLFKRREDDSVSTLKNRYSIYMNETLPIIKLLEKDYNTIHIDGNKSRKEIQKKIRETLGQFL